jgi:microcystin-dependent protein
MPNPVQFAPILASDVADGANMPAGFIGLSGCLPGSPPSGWLLCDGSAISRTTYAALFTAISTRFGVGDGSTTFNIPDLIAKYPVGIATSGTAPGTAVGALAKSHSGTAVATHASGGSHAHDAHTSSGINTTGGGTTLLTGPASHSADGGHTHDAHAVTQPSDHTDIRPPSLELTPLIKT